MKLYFLRSAESALAEPKGDVIDAVRADLLARPDVAEVDSAEAADAIVLHEPWAFREWRYIDRLLADPVASRFPHRIYTINMDDAGTGLLRGIYAGLPLPRLDPALHASVPFLVQHNEYVQRAAGTPRPEPEWLATWRGNPYSNRKLRGGLLETFKDSSTLNLESSERWLDHGEDEKRHYVDMVRSGRFSLCPAGWTSATFRIYESLALGIAPVIIADHYAEPVGPDWRAMSLRIAQADIHKLPQLLEREAHRYEALGARAYQAWDRYFRPERLIHYYADELLRLMRASAGTGSAAGEIDRWRSRRMYWTNRWSLPQRVAIKVRRLVA